MDSRRRHGGKGGRVTPAERLERARELLDQVRDELAAAADDAPAYAIESLRFVRAELGVIDRRLQNAARVLGGTPRPAA